MPQVVVVIDNRISCETILHDQDPNPENNNNNNNNNKIDEDLPAESYFLAKEEEVEWIDRNAVFDRKDSDKAINYHQSTTVKISSHHHNNNTSQRFKSKPSIIGLPKPPPPPPPHPNTTLRRATATATARFFPKRSSSSLSEPSSPKVSCIGRVRSRKCRHRKPHDSSSAGFWSAFRDALSLGCRKAQSVEVHDGSAAAESSEPAVGPPGLGGMNRFTSGRRSDAWPGDQGLRRGGPQEVC